MRLIIGQPEGHAEVIMGGSKIGVGLDGFSKMNNGIVVAAGSGVDEPDAIFPGCSADLGSRFRQYQQRAGRIAGTHALLRLTSQAGLGVAVGISGDANQNKSSKNLQPIRNYRKNANTQVAFQ